MFVEKNKKTLVPERSNLYDHSLYFLYGFRIWNDGQNTANDDHKVTAVSRQGVKEIGELILTDKEKEQFAGSCSIIKQAIQLLSV